MNHEFIIWTIIVFIVLFQSNILIKTLRNINNYKKILDKPSKFQTCKVYIPVDEIETIDPSHIIDNLNHYKQNPNLKSESSYSISYKNQFEDELEDSSTFELEDEFNENNNIIEEDEF
jgi:hypothetical protein